ncbi:MAG: hypothetical protein AAGI17_06245 [Planctomycetota bacterium]
MLRQPNFGVIRIDWDRRDPVLSLEGFDLNGNALMSSTIRLSDLSE